MLKTHILLYISLTDFVKVLYDTYAHDFTHYTLLLKSSRTIPEPQETTPPYALNPLWSQHEMHTADSQNYNVLTLTSRLWNTLAI